MRHSHALFVLFAACAPTTGDATVDAGTEGTVNRTVPFALASAGCPMAHCDPQMSDRDPIVPPAAGKLHWKDTAVSGAFVGLGCSSNGTIAACSLIGAGLTPSLIVYNGDGPAHVWDSSLLASTAIASAPIIDSMGGVIAADANKLLRFDSTGALIWWAPVPGGIPISPVPIGSSFIFLATGGDSNHVAPLALYNASNGATIQTASVYEPGDDGRTYYYETANTPAVSGTRAYVVMQRVLTSGATDPNPVGRLIAFDLSSSGIKEAWRSAAFRAPSGASPLVIGNRIFFDGAGLDPNQAPPPDSGLMFGVQDNQSSGDVVWTYDIHGPTQASASEDPRGGFWVWTGNKPIITHLSVDGVNESDSITNIDTLLGRTGAAQTTGRSAVSMTGPNTAGVMILSLGRDLLQNSVCALALGPTTSSPVTERWCYDSPGVAAGQFPIVADHTGAPVVIYATGFTGVVALGN